MLKASLELEYGDDEVYLKVQKLTVLEHFCDNVINMLCEQHQKRTIEELSDRYTFRSIVSRCWLLVFSLFTEQAQILYEYDALKNIFQT